MRTATVVTLRDDDTHSLGTAEWVSWTACGRFHGLREREQGRCEGQSPDEPGSLRYRPFSELFSP
jgi:hypothetical protein